MSDPADDEVHQIVQRVLKRYAGLSNQSPAASAGASTPVTLPQTDPNPTLRKVIAIGADHGGFELKEILKPELTALGYDYIDVGTNTKDAVDYPDFAHEVAKLVSSGKAWRGVMIDGAGIGSCIVANKVPGVRAGMAYDYSSALNSREHNDTNLLTLGAGLIGVALAKQILKVWLSTPFGGERHQRRVNKITAVEKLYTK
ncbi:ribose-5-phosphate isomerase [Longilinea arvoryzae]|uniref:Ribose-5-phosphate isomerase n=1 Tax=Longilinea arvoryzae TaxID=360412 RepID=A0A0S7BP76_9CHLR|nr:ribose 5-phosphate isomerase B [Longilinea arvoryzae]GAP15745.1 ribose-5-phosphate isomerase [Longilinea arvoryzae]